MPSGRNPSSLVPGIIAQLYRCGMFVCILMQLGVWESAPRGRVHRLAVKKTQSRKSTKDKGYSQLRRDFEAGMVCPPPSTRAPAIQFPEAVLRGEDILADRSGSPRWHCCISVPGRANLPVLSEAFPPRDTGGAVERHRPAITTGCPMTAPSPLPVSLMSKAACRS